MSWFFNNLFLVPLLPLAAAAVLALTKQPRRTLAATLAIGSMALAFLLSAGAFLSTLGPHSTPRRIFNFDWFQLGDSAVRLGWLLDPLTASMIVMVTFVGALIFVYSVGYMAHDDNSTRFFCFLALFAAAMLGLVISNNLLLLFICWELVGFASYILIGFWYHKPSAAAAAKKAFITTRIGDIGFFLGLLWLYSETGTLLLYDNGQGCLEQSALAKLIAQTATTGLAASTGISLLIFCGAIGKSGQVPLHVWLPDAMEGPTPVSALIHAATMVAAGVFLVARMFPLMDADPANLPGLSSTLTVVTWVGAITAVFAASIAVAQNDIKRILAYSTVSQLGYMMMGLGVGGVAVGMFHLITHAFFKALLFMGAGSVIHGCHDEHDIRFMGGLRRFMPTTFLTYAVGMMALCGVPFFFSGFWSKDEILHAAHQWTVSATPFYLGLLGAFLTAFYMTRQIYYVFFGQNRAAALAPSHNKNQYHSQTHQPHESPSVITLPLVILATCAVLLGIIGTPAWPWFETYLNGHHSEFNLSKLFSPATLAMMSLSILVVAAGLGAGWWWYGRQPLPHPQDPDPLQKNQPDLFAVLQNKYYVDELYEATVLRATAAWANISAWLDRWVWNGAVQLLAYLVLALSWLNRLADEYLINLGFDKSCYSVKNSGSFLSRLQDGQIQNYLRVIGLALTLLLLLLTWGCRL